MVDRKQAVNHLQRNQMTLECKGKTQGGGKLQKQQTKKRRERECKTIVGKNAARKRTSKTEKKNKNK